MGSKFRDLGGLFNVASPSADPLESITFPNGQLTESGKIVNVPTDRFRPYHNHTFDSYDEEEMEELIESIRAYGVQQPVKARPYEGEYEIIFGHTRWEAARRAGLPTIPAIIENLDDDTADIIMVQTNINQRKKIKPSELARSYRVMYEAQKRQGKRNDLINGEETGKRSVQDIADKEKKSAMTIFRYNRMGYLNAALLELADEKRINPTVGYELSYLDEDSQNILADYLQQHKNLKPTQDQAQVLRAQAATSPLSDYTIAKVFHEKNREKKEKPLKTIKLPVKEIRSCFTDEEFQDLDESSLIDLITQAIREFKNKGMDVQRE